MKKILTFALLIIVIGHSFGQSNSYPTSGAVTVFDYSPCLILQRNTLDGGFIQGIQTKFLNGTNNWYFGALHDGQWIVSKGDFQNAKLTVLSGGNVGIGDPYPSGKLSIRDGNQVLTFLTNQKLAGAWPPEPESTTMTIQSSGSSAGNLAFAVGNGEIMRITSSNKVAIGTTNPDADALLTVKGNINSREVKVTANAGADFVFDENYPIKSLDEVEAYIKQNKHLPEIAPAKEMVEKGIELGEMNIKLLQKVEELTLYLIEQDKRLKKLEEENGKLKSRIEELELN
jgi:hypothetical protein